MTERKAYALIVATAMAVTTVAVLGLHALGARGEALSLGALIPLFVAAPASARVVMHYSAEKRRRGR